MAPELNVLGSGDDPWSAPTLPSTGAIPYLELFRATSLFPGLNPENQTTKHRDTKTQRPFGSWPQRFVSLLVNLLETNRHRTSHCTTFLNGLYDPYTIWEVAPPNRRQLPVTASPKGPPTGPSNPGTSPSVQF